jgi:hypothetical protein
MLEIGKQFRPSTSIIYPPFKKGRYMEEYFYEYFIKNIKNRKETRVYWCRFVHAEALQLDRKHPASHGCELHQRDHPEWSNADHHLSRRACFCWRQHHGVRLG